MTIPIEEYKLRVKRIDQYRKFGKKLIDHIEQEDVKVQLNMYLDGLNRLYCKYHDQIMVEEDTLDPCAVRTEEIKLPIDLSRIIEKQELIFTSSYKIPRPLIESLLDHPEYTLFYFIEEINNKFKSGIRLDENYLF